MAIVVLGISAFYHDSAAALVSDGEIIAAVQEERFSRKKHDPRFPVQSINYCLEEAFIDPSDLDAIVFYDNPWLTFDRVLKNYLVVGREGSEQFEKAMQSVLGVKVWVQDHIQRALGCLGKMGRVLYSQHHMAHAASAFYPSPFQEAAIITLDGVGEWETTTVGRGSRETIELWKTITYPHSLGLLYSAFTYFCGFKVNSGEYKLMGLAPYGQPKYVQAIRDHLIDIKEDGSFRLNTDYYGYLSSSVMTNSRFENLFGGPPRKPEGPITRRERDLAASIQRITEEVIILLARHARRETGLNNLSMAGGVALNCVANGRLLTEKIFDSVWIQPASGDAGGALGAALLASHVYFGVSRQHNSTGRDSQKGSYLGPTYTPEEIFAFLERHGYPYQRVNDPVQRAQRIARLIADGEIVGFVSGRMEFGPRALGARSILGDARSASMQSDMNMKIKFRESFRPFAPSVLLEDTKQFFDLEGESPYMLFVGAVREERRKNFDEDAVNCTEDLRAIVNQVRSDIPAVTHVDYSARVQTVRPEYHPEFYRVLQEFKNITGFGLLINTSFNVRGEPIVCSPQDAYKCFMRTGMGVLVLGDYILLKSEQPEFHERVDWRAEYDLD